jgi:hypothetical protein
MVCNNMITSCPVTSAAVTNAYIIFCPGHAGVRGTTVRRPQDAVMTEYVQILQAILDQFQLVKLAADIIFVYGVS